jgi:hypothetical protein
MLISSDTIAESLEGAFVAAGNYGHNRIIVSCGLCGLPNEVRIGGASASSLLDPEASKELTEWVRMHPYCAFCQVVIKRPGTLLRDALCGRFPRPFGRRPEEIERFRRSVEALGLDPVPDWLV